MHYAGFACDMPAILEIAGRHHLKVIEDAAHAVGSELEGRRLGTWGDIGCYSFFSNKNMTTGEGGMLATGDDALAERLHILRSHGMTSLSWDRHQGHASTYDVVDLGYNYRIDEMRSALGRVQLKKLPLNNERRKQLTGLYREMLAELAPDLHIPFNETRGTACYHIMPVLLPVGVDRFRFMEGMKAQGVQTSIHYPPVHRFHIYQQDGFRSRSALPLTDEAADREVTLPLYPTMQAEQVECAARAVQNVLQAIGGNT
jgi:dTDP-4-amino-4,6-dideoxygalactose transaminase